MNGCDWLPKVHAYYDGEAPAEARAGIEAHLTQCAACARELEELRALSHLIAATPLPTIRPEAVRRLHRTTDSIMDRVLVRMSEYVTAAAAAIIAACGLWIWHADRAAVDYSTPALDSLVLSARADLSPADAETQIAQYIVADMTKGK